MIQKAIERLETLVQQIPGIIKNIPDTEFESIPAPGKWSKKEILGHLCDSAANNYQRFIRTQFESIPRITYLQNEWNRAAFHQESDRTHLLEFWTVFNKQILHVIKHLNAESLDLLCDSGDSDALTLSYLIEDYVVHLEHHLKQIAPYDF